MKKNSALILTCVALVLGSCADSVGQRGALRSDSLVVSGRVQLPATTASISSAATYIGAFSIVAGTIGLDTIDSGILVPVQPDGSFSTTLPTDEDRVLLYCNPDASSKEDMVIGFVTIDGNASSVLRIPIPYAISDIDLGLLNPVDNEFQTDASTADFESIFELSIDELDELARVDDVFKMLKNYYMNYDAETGIYYRIVIRYDWGIKKSISQSEFHSPEDYHFGGYEIPIYTNNVSAHPYEQFQSGDIQVSIYPPAEVSSDDGQHFRTYGPDVHNG